MPSVDLSSITDTLAHFDFSDDSVTGLGLANPSLARASLYGRSQESQKLKTEYDKVLQTKQVNRLVVHGESGSGKTALVESLREVACGSHGNFVAGKFFQNEGVQESYSAVMAAFSDLCDLVIQSEDFDDARRIKIQQALGSEVHLLTKTITNLSPFIDESKHREEEIDLRTESSFALFKVACKTFLNAMASDEHPVILFIDDIQWADDGSRALLDMFLLDTKLTNVFIILAYRDEEKAGVANILDKAEYVDIALKSLDTPAIHEMVSHTVPNTSCDIEALSDLVAKRTAGNPFHVVQFLESILSEGLLKLDRLNQTWVFDVDEIQSMVMVSITAAELLTRKIQRLRPELADILKIASLLGYRFEEKVIIQAAFTFLSNLQQPDGNSRKQIAFALSSAISDGYVEKTKDGYQFTHDKVQAAFQSLIDEEEEEHMHMIIGEAFLSQEQNTASAYNAAVHLNSAPDYCKTLAQRVKLAHINHKAAIHCREKSAFPAAASFLRRGLEQLSETERWSEENFDITYDMMESLAKMELVIGNLDACKEATKQTLLRGKSVEMKIPSLLIDIEVLVAGQELNAVIAIATRTLKILGVRIPQKIGIRHVVAKFLRVKRMLASLTDEDILGLPEMKNLPTSTAVRILSDLSMSCFLQHKLKDGVFASMQAVELTLKDGLSGYSAYALAMYGVAESAMGNHDRGFRYGQLALTLLNRIKCSDAECPTVCTVLLLVSHWKQTFGELVGPLFKAVSVGYEVGDVVFGTYGLSGFCMINNLRGIHLDQQETMMTQHYEKVKDMGQETLLLWVQPGVQFILNLRCQGANARSLVELTGEIMDEFEYFERVKNANYPVLVAAAQAVKMQLVTYFGCYDVGEALISEMAPYQQILRYSYGVIPYYFTSSHTFFELSRMYGKRQHLRKARKFKKLMGKITTLGYPTAAAFFAFLGAMELALKKSTSDAQLESSYDAAIMALSDASKQYEGLANEHAGFAFARRSCRSKAESYFARAMQIYKDEWGSYAKYEQLQTKSFSALARLPGKTNCAPFVGETILCDGS